MFIVILSIAGIIFEEFEALELPINPTIIRVMRVLRIARVLKLLKMAKGTFNFFIVRIVTLNFRYPIVVGHCRSKLFFQVYKH